jgi:hypothetical protein
MKHAIFAILGAVLLFAVLVLPNHPNAIGWSALAQFPLELPILLLAMVVFGHRDRIAAVIAAVLVAAAFLKLADIGMFVAYNRVFNPILDAFLINAGIGLLGESIGAPLTYVAVAVAVILVLGLFYLVLQSLRVWGRIQIATAGRVAAAIAVLGFGSWAAADVGHAVGYWRFEPSVFGTARTSQLVVKRAVDVRATLADLVQFKRDAKKDSYANAKGLLGRLHGRDVMVIYIESYGRTSFDNALYAPTHTATLRAAQASLARAGLAVKSGWMTSPTAGGQSWLAHGTLSSGLWASNQGRYTAMLASGKKTLFHIAQEAGYRTSAFMPAITMAWPESSAMGFDLVFAAADFPYKGNRFNWVTMPDQFTLNAYAELLPQDPRADFIQIALISSHAPWVPIPDMVAWDDISDGLIFNEMAARGPTPRELWKNHDNVREAYRRAIDYSLQVTFDHIARLGDDAPLVVVLGDHQPAGFVAGSDNRDVPVHLIGPPDLVALIDPWGWNDGLIPSPTGPVRPMDTFRDSFIAAFSDAPLLTGAHE